MKKLHKRIKLIEHIFVINLVFLMILSLISSFRISEIDAEVTATYTQQTNPDGVYSFNGKNTVTDEDGNEIDILVDKDKNHVDGKEALWEDENKTKGSIILSYKRDNVQSLYLATMCSAHGMDNATFSEELNALARLTDVNLYLEGWDFYGSSFGIENLSGAAERAENIPWQSGMKVINQSSGHQYIERIPTSEEITLGEGKYQYKNIAPNPAYNNPEAFTPDYVLYDGLKHNGSTITLSGEHANVIAFAKDIVEMLTPPADPVAKAEWEKNVKPEFIIMSFDANAWASAGAGLESDDWKEDAAVMKQAAELLKEYYPSADNPQSRVLWLVPDEVYSSTGARSTNDNAIGDYGLVSPAEFGAEQNPDNPVPYVYTFGRGVVRYAEQYFNYPRSTDDYKSIFITPFGLSLTYKGPEYATAIDDFKSDPYENLERDVEQAGRVLTRDQYVDFAKEWRTSIGIEGLSTILRYNLNNNNTSNTAANARRNMLANKTYVKYFAKSKRIPFYQFALLDPVTYLSCVDANGEPTNIPTYESWYDEGKNIRAMKDSTLNYSDAQKITNYINNNFVEYDSYVFEDTVSADLKLDDKNYTKNTDADSNTAGKTVEVQYWDEESETWKPVEKTYLDVDGKTQKNDGFDVKIENQKVTVTMKNINYLGERVRVIIHVINDDFSFVTENGDPKDTNEGDATVECQKNGESLNNGASKVNYPSPKLRKLPDTASISIFKKWDDKDNQDGLRKEVAKVKLESKLGDGEYGQAEDVNGNKAEATVVPVKDGLVVTWLNMPIHKNGVEFTYNVIEDISGLSGYTTSIDKEDFGLTKDENIEVVVTNSLTPELTEITITKEWDDESDKEGLRPDNISVTLEKEYKAINTEKENVNKQVIVAGEKYDVKETSGDEPIEYFEINGKYYRSDDISKENGETTDYEELIVFAPSPNDENVQITENKVVTVEDNEYDVRVTSDGIEYYIKDDKYYNPEDNSELELSDSFKPTEDDKVVTEEVDKITNVDNNEYEVKLNNNIEYYENNGKYYDLSDNELLIFDPQDDDVNVEVETDKEPTYTDKTDEDSVTLKETDSWTITLTDLNANAPEGQEIAYGVKEEDVPEGYEATVTSTEPGVFVIKNTHIVPKYTIKYDANGGSGNMSDDVYKGGDKTMPSKGNTFTRDGYTFTGFIAYDEDGNELLEGKLFNSIEDFVEYFKDKPDGTSVTLVAQWQPIVKTHWVTYIDPDGTVYTVKTNYNEKDTEIPAPNPRKDGFVFKGWDRSEDADGNVTYVAIWEPTQETIPPKPSTTTYIIPKTGVE